MEDYAIAKAEALKNLKVADHMLTVTYPLVQDTKLLLAVLDNIFLSLTKGMEALLEYERLYKRVPPFQDTFESKFNMFRMKCVDRYNIPKEYLSFISQVKEIIDEHKKSPVEFRRKDKFVICSEDYSLKAISIKEIKDFLLKTKLFVDNIVKVIDKNERHGNGS